MPMVRSSHQRLMHLVQLTLDLYFVGLFITIAYIIIKSR